MRVPVCGRVSMDMITLDLTDLTEEPSVGDEVVLLGRQEWPPWDRAGADSGAREAAILAEEMAEAIDTISYEITCGFTPRIPRIYRGPGESDARPL
jgi:alanine racemase